MNYFLWDYDAGKVTEYERLGECRKCGQCCQAEITFMTCHAHGEDGRNGDIATDGKGQWEEVSAGDNRRFFKTISITPNTLRCKQLNTYGECIRHDDGTRAACCTDWPWTLFHVVAFPECGYSFVAKGSWSL